ncbi:MAG: DNA primase [Bacteroidetes bacterium]|nr:MAG: DNA primase [Bacteroidota bacterium]
MIPAYTIANILETARIEEVVGEFVGLKRRGSNLIGLCPFHQEKTPSFSVSPGKGIFKCFGCGKGGDSARFIMEHEHVSYPDAIRYLARKYQIEIEEEQQSPEELAALNERERMFNLNTFAQGYFTHTLFETNEGRSIGLSYFKERDFREAITKKFQLGYSPDHRDTFSVHAKKNGYTEDILLKTGLSVGSEERLFDRFQGRVIFPIHNLTGKVLGFGGRILSGDKTKAKYLNSPESEIYNKSKTLYGIFFAKNAIVKHDNCLLVEGYTDVISMHQAGIENVVASSGTSLTTDQIRLIRRYTNNITILYDGDKAGINASLRGTDMILEEGMNVRVLLFPDGDDPDSFVRKNRSSDVESYISNNAKDFISFKTALLLEESAHDPIKKAGLIKEIVHTISLIPEPIYRSVYVKECSRMLEVEEQTLMNELNKLLRQKFKSRTSTDIPEPVQETPAKQETIETGPEAQLGYYQERELVKILLQYGNKEITHELTDEQGFPTTYTETVARLIIDDLLTDDLWFEYSPHKKIQEHFVEALKEEVVPSEKFFINHPEPDTASLAVDLLTSPYELHNWESRSIFVKTEVDVLKLAITNSIFRYKDQIIEARQKAISEKLKESTDFAEQMGLMIQKKKYDDLRRMINQQLGIVIIK